jgi:hypothetical protein
MGNIIGSCITILIISCLQNSLQETCLIIVTWGEKINCFIKNMRTVQLLSYILVLFVKKLMKPILKDSYDGILHL